mgnify:CR=1 FL=1
MSRRCTSPAPTTSASPTERHTDIHGLLALINEKMWLGHFDLWTDEGLPMFRHAIPLRGTAGLMPEQLERPGRGRDQRKRALLSRLSVRRVGRQDARRRAHRLDPRDGRRSLSGKGPSDAPLAKNTITSRLCWIVPSGAGPQTGAAPILRPRSPGYNPRPMNALLMPYPDIDPVLVQLGPFAIRWYALAYIAGLVIGWQIMRRVCAAAAQAAVAGQDRRLPAVGGARRHPGRPAGLRAVLQARLLPREPARRS